MSHRAFLKSETANHHRQAESLWSTANGFADVHTYHRWLAAMHAVHARCGLSSATRLARQDLIDQERGRLEALLQDLDAMAKPPPSPVFGSVSWSWGVQYVLNGSAMGASILLKTGSVAPEWPIGYLKHMSDFSKSGALRSFFSDLDAAEIDRAKALQGAQAAFPIQSLDLV